MPFRSGSRNPEGNDVLIIPGKIGPCGDTIESLMLQIRNQKDLLNSQCAAAVGGVPYQQVTDLAGWKETTFNPKVHLAPRREPDMKYTFQDLGIQQPASASSDIAGTAPFPLYTAKSIPLIRKALLNPRYIDKTAAIFGPKTLIIRNAAAHSPFFRRLCTHQSVIDRLSHAAGVALEPVMETMELGHANIQVDFSKYSGLSREETLNKIAYDLTSQNYKAEDVRNKVESRSAEEIRQAVEEQSLLPWHFDSYPWVAVAMVSDSANMIGGETVIQHGDMEYVGLTQPGMGSVMMLQGGLVKHLALPSSSSDDRITIITSFRAKAVGIYDSSFMSNIRPYSDLQELYRQWIDYRLNRLEPGVKKLHDRLRFVQVFDEQDSQEVDEERVVLKEYAKRTLRQMIPPKIVKPLTDRLGCQFFYHVRDNYVSGDLFKHPLTACELCKVPGAMVEKAHLSVCSEKFCWRPDIPVWNDYIETYTLLLQLDESFELRKRMEELQVKDVITKWRAESRPWGILDELAVQGLGEYMVEYLELCGMRFP